MAKVTKKKAKPKDDKNTATPFPDTIFGRQPAEYSIPLMKRILAIFRKRVVKGQRGKVLLARLAVVEQERSLLEQYAITQLLRRSIHITRKAIAEWPETRDKWVDEGLEDDEDLPARICVACQETLPSLAFRHSKITPDCQHGCDLCGDCMVLWVASQLNTEDSDWTEIRCPSCPLFMRPEAIRRYAAPVTLEEHARLPNIKTVTDFRKIITNSWSPSISDICPIFVDVAQSAATLAKSIRTAMPIPK